MSALFAFSAQVERRSVFLSRRLYRRLSRCTFAFYGYTTLVMVISFTCLDEVGQLEKLSRMKTEILRQNLCIV